MALFSEQEEIVVLFDSALAVQLSVRLPVSDCRFDLVLHQPAKHCSSYQDLSLFETPSQLISVETASDNVTSLAQPRSNLVHSILYLTRVGLHKSLDTYSHNAKHKCEWKQFKKFASMNSFTPVSYPNSFMLSISPLPSKSSSNTPRSWKAGRRLLAKILQIWRRLHARRKRSAILYSRARVGESGYTRFTTHELADLEFIRRKLTYKLTGRSKDFAVKQEQSDKTFAEALDKEMKEKEQQDTVTHLLSEATTLVSYVRSPLVQIC